MSGTSTVVPLDQFRQEFPAFGDRVKYTDAACTMYLTLANGQLNGTTWGQLFALGQELFAAHFLTLDAADQAAAARGALPGQVNGPVASKSVGSVSVSYDASSTVELDAGHWNLTTYGRRFIRFARMAGMGPSQIC